MQALLVGSYPYSQDKGMQGEREREKGRGGIGRKGLSSREA